MSIAREGDPVVQEPNFADGPDDSAGTPPPAPTSAPPPISSGPPEVTCASASRERPASNLLDGDLESYWQSNGTRSIELKSSTAGAPLGKLEIYLKRFGSKYEPRVVEIRKRRGGSGSWALVKEVRLEIDGGWTELISASEAGNADQFKIDITDCDGGADCKVTALRVSGGSAGSGGAGGGGGAAVGRQGEELIPAAASDAGALTEWTDIKEEGTGSGCRTLD